MASPAAPLDQNKSKNSTRGFAFGFSLRAALVILAFGLLMSASNVNIGAIGQGLALSLVGVGVFITFRILNFPDLTVDGAFPVGGAITATLIVNAGVPAEITLPVAFLFGALTGLSTALIHIIFRVEGLLASIIVSTGAYTIVLRIMGTSNIPLLTERTILSDIEGPVRTFLVEQFGDEMRRQSNNLVEIGVFLAAVAVVLLLLNWFMHTEMGLALRATGKNTQMVRALGVNDKLFIVIGLMVSNGLSGLAGSLVVQQLGFADVQLGVGMIIRGLAAVMIGEVLLRPRTVGQMLIASAGGMIVFEVSRAWVFAALDLPASDIRLMSALVVLAALATPYIIDRYRAFQRRRHLREPQA